MSHAAWAWSAPDDKKILELGMVRQSGIAYLGDRIVELKRAELWKSTQHRHHLITADTDQIERRYALASNSPVEVRLRFDPRKGRRDLHFECRIVMVGPADVGRHRLPVGGHTF